MIINSHHLAYIAQALLNSIVGFTFCSILLWCSSLERGISYTSLFLWFHWIPLSYYRYLSSLAILHRLLSFSSIALRFVPFLPSQTLEIILDWPGCFGDAALIFSLSYFPVVLSRPVCPLLKAIRASHRDGISFYLSWFIATFDLCLMLNQSCFHSFVLQSIVEVSEFLFSQYSLKCYFDSVSLV